ncbi:MAG: FAD-binding oxidoreductase [Deltaproteobacteria bacterium]|nr:FAD-binding oxidoreductase [Deltaproteobacteria bacterium]MBW2265358.1 FAD-binding oxidoreductase [Deltaproteobacteria bacterium]
MSFPANAKYVIIGAGIHGLSTAWHLALELKAKKAGSGKDVLVIDKGAIGAGASGIACGIIRNNYFQPAMRELMAHSVALWEEDAEGYGYHPVGYMQISPEVMHADVAEIHKQQNQIGYESVFIEGENDCMKYMKENIFHDWQAKNITSVLHEKKGGYAHNTKSLYRLADKAEAEGVRIITGVEVTGLKTDNDAVTAVETAKGDIECEWVIIGAGPWAKGFWDMLALPNEIDIKGKDGKLHKGVQMWTYWCLVEGTLGVPPEYAMNNEGKMPPVIHVDSDAPLYSSEDGSLITDKLWGIYYKPDFHFGGVQGGAAPYIVKGDVSVDPYGIDSPDFTVTPEFVHMWTSALAYCQKRYEDRYKVYKNEPSGGIGAFTPDNFPVFDVFKQNCFMILDSNHGYKMLGIGKLVAKQILGEEQALLKPFRFDRYVKGKLHPVSHSPFPWS